MSRRNEQSSLEKLIGEIDVGHYRKTMGYLEPKVKQMFGKAKKILENRPDFLSGDPDFPLGPEAEPLLPMGEFQKIVQKCHNNLLDRLGGACTFGELEEEISVPLERVNPQIEELEEKIETLKRTRDRFEELAEQYDTIDEAKRDGALPEEVRERYDLPPGTEFEVRNQLPTNMREGQLPEGEEVQFEPFYDAGDLLRDSQPEGLRRQSARYVHRGVGSPIRIATQAHTAIEDLHDDLRPKQKTKVICQLRLDILKYFRRYRGATDTLPDETSETEVESESAGYSEFIKSSDTNEEELSEGRPETLNESNLRNAVIKVIGEYCNCWHSGGRHEGVNKSQTARRIRKEYPEVLRKPDGDKHKFTYVRQKVGDVLERIPETGKKKLKGEACGES